MRVCNKCKVDLPDSSFYPDDYPWCAECRREDRRRRWRDDPEHRAKCGADQDKWRRKNPERAKELRRKAVQKLRARAKAECLERYGSKCVCCGEAEKDFLVLDHINNDGHSHRMAVGGRRTGPGSMCVWARQHGFPPMFQTLCANCNTSKAKPKNKGRCIHAINREQT